MKQKPKLKQWSIKMSRYINRNQLTVSQEFTVIELAVGVGIGVGIYKAIKKLTSDSKTQAKAVKGGKSVETLADALTRVSAKLEKSSYIRGTGEAPFGLLGEPTSDNASDIIEHLKKITIPVRKLLVKVEPQFDKIKKIEDEYNNDGDEIDFDEVNETAVNKLKTIINEALPSGIDINGFELNSTGNRITCKYNPSYGKGLKSIRSPIPSQGGSLLTIAGQLLELHLKAKQLPFLDYAQGESEWVPDLAEMLEITLRALITYLDNSYE